MQSSKDIVLCERRYVALAKAKLRNDPIEVMRIWADGEVVWYGGR